MKLKNKNLVGLLSAGAVSMSASINLWADARPSPFQSIVARNAFGLTNPPSEPKASILPPEKAPAAVRLTGLTSIWRQKKALFEITEAPGKPLRKVIMAEGERDGDIELLSIDLAKAGVTIKNGTVVTNITFEVPRSAPAPKSNSGSPPDPVMAPSGAAAFGVPGIPSGRSKFVIAGNALPTGAAFLKDGRPVAPPPSPVPQIGR